MNYKHLLTSLFIAWALPPAYADTPQTEIKKEKFLKKCEDNDPDTIVKLRETALRGVCIYEREVPAKKPKTKIIKQEIFKRCSKDDPDTPANIRALPKISRWCFYKKEIEKEVPIAEKSDAKKSVKDPEGESMVVQRCKEDDLYAIEQIQGRNAWAVKCGYLQEKSRIEINIHEQYATFLNYKAPVEPDAPCIGGLKLLAVCFKGCFTASQELLFSDGYEAIEPAALSHKNNLITLSDLSTLQQLYFKESKIEHFVAGDYEENQDTIVLTSEHGNTLEVTKNHPMVDATGQIVPANEVKEGAMLLLAAGPSKIVSVQYRTYHGRVWNVNPASQNVASHINVANDFLTGSVRFQNEWSHEAYRLMLRDKLQVSQL